MSVKIHGVTISAGFPFAAAVALMLALDKSGTALTALFCCIMHECGHLACLVLMGSPPRTVTLGAFGMRIDSECMRTLSYSREAAAALSGPAVNFLLAAVFFLISQAGAAGVTRLAALNLCTGLFNLIPVEPLDGSRALRALLLKRFSEQSCERIMNVFTALVLLPLTACGAAVLIKSRYNFTLILVCLYMAAYLIFKGARRRD